MIWQFVATIFPSRAVEFMIIGIRDINFKDDCLIIPNSFIQCFHIEMHDKVIQGICFILVVRWLVQIAVADR